MNSDYFVNVRTIFRHNRITEERINIKFVIAHVKNGHLIRVKEWIQSDHPYIPGYEHPFKVTKIKFNKNGNLEFLEVSQER